jgi:hypothetical protein
MSHFGPQLKVFSDSFPSQVEVTVLHPEFVASVGIILNGEWWSNGTVEHNQL